MCADHGESSRRGCAVWHLVGEEVVGHLRRTVHVAGTLQAEQQQVHDEAVELDDERRKLQAPDDAVRVRVVHVLKRQRRASSAHNQTSDKSIRMACEKLHEVRGVRG